MNIKEKDNEINEKRNQNDELNTEIKELNASLQLKLEEHDKATSKLTEIHK